MWVCYTYQDILLVSRLELHEFSVLGNTSKAAAASVAYKAEFCHWEICNHDTWSHGPINKDKMTKHCQNKMAFNTEFTEKVIHLRKCV